MPPFPTPFSALAAPLPVDNVDTDAIIPKQFLKTIGRTGLKKGLFFDLRGPDFVLDRAPYTHAQILIAGANFGCGSSREHAPWALLDFGIRAIIAPGFADIFYNNCFKNGILPIVLSRAEVDALLQYAAESADKTITVDLENQTVITSHQPSATSHFQIDPFRKKCLLEGLDDIALTLAHAPAIDAFETRQRQEMPWLY